MTEDCSYCWRSDVDLLASLMLRPPVSAAQRMLPLVESIPATAIVRDSQAKAVCGG